MGLAYLAAALLAHAVDLPIAAAFLCNAEGYWPEIRQKLQDLVQPGETFAHGYGVLLVLTVIVTADVGRRRLWLRAGALILCAGIFALLLKVLIARVRPHLFFDVDSGQFAGGVFDTFVGWLPLSGIGHAGQSLPSGHATTAAALAIVLSCRWPQATWAFVAVACLAGMQRVFVGSHYLSDCFAGAALACLTAALVYHPRLAGRWFNQYETRQHLAARLPWPPVASPSSEHEPIRRAA